MMSGLDAQTNRRNEILTGLIVLGISFGGFLLGEIGLRIFQWSKFGVQTAVERSSAFYTEEDTGLRLIHPNRQLGKVRINNLGFRGPDVTPAKRDSILRLLFLGSSTTYDAGSPEGVNWPEGTVDLLRDGLSGCDIDFINAGQPGYSTETMLRLYAEKLRYLDPDFAVILPGDVNKDLDWQAQNEAIVAKHYEPNWLAKRSILWGKLDKNFRVIQLQRQAFSRVGKLQPDIPALTGRFSDRLLALTEALESDGVAAAVLAIGSQMRSGQDESTLLQAGNTQLFFMPYISLHSLVEVREFYNETIRELASQSHFVHLDSSLKIPADRQHYSDSMHFTPTGSRYMAHQLSNDLLESEQFQESAFQRGCYVAE